MNRKKTNFPSNTNYWGSTNNTGMSSWVAELYFA